MGVVMMPIIGKQMARGVPPLPFVVTGFLLFALYGYLSSTVSPDVNKWDFFVPLVIRALGITMVQLPLINQAVAGLPAKDYASAIALNNMIRQLGGAFGIAISNNYIANQHAQHRADLVSNLQENNPLLQQRLAGMTQNMIAKTGDAITAKAQALKFLDLTIDKQAFYLSYLDTFRLVAIFFIIVTPFAVFLKKKNADPKAAMKAAAESH
jgi:DHA2 family multidrug resistance protein